jgi:hypothetical protein
MARTNRSGLTSPLIDALKKKGYNQTQIGEMFGVTRQHVSWVKNHYGGVTQTAREEAMEHWPFKAAGARFHDSTFDRRLRDHLEYMHTRGEGMADNKLRRLYSFYKRLEIENLVVEFDPNIPPTEGNSVGGYALRPKEESDGDLIIRVNEHTELTPAGQAVWRFPPELPAV